MGLGEKISKIRKDNNLTQEEFAQKYFVTRQTVSSWENGKSYPDLETLIKISNDFSISLDKLLKNDNKMIKFISKKQKKYEYINIFIILLYALSILYLLYFTIKFSLYTFTDINSTNYDKIDFSILMICVGLIPMLIINYMAYTYYDLKNKLKRLLFFIPSIIYIIITIGMLTHSESWFTYDKNCTKKDYYIYGIRYKSIGCKDIELSD